MEMDPNPPQFNLTYDVKPMDIGEGYAKGIESAGKSLSDATKGVFDVMQRNQTANDMISTLVQGKMMDPEMAKTLAGKSLSAKEAMTGMYANQWILDQAERRAAELQQGSTSGISGALAVEHQKFIDLYNSQRGKYPVQPKPTQPQPPAPRAQPVQPQAQSWAGPQGQPSPLAQGGNITNPVAAAQPNAPNTMQPPLVMGKPFSPKEAIPRGAKWGQVGDQLGWRFTDPNTGLLHFRPVNLSK